MHLFSDVFAEVTAEQMTETERDELIRIIDSMEQGERAE